MTISDRLKIARKDANESQKTFAGKCSVSVQMWQAYEAGKSVPGGNVLESIARMGFNGHWLLTGDGEMRKAVRLTESEAHQALKERLTRLPAATGMQAHLGRLAVNGISEQTYRAYVYGDYLPTKQELEGLCNAAGGWLFETGTIATRSEEAEAEIGKRVQEAIKLQKTNSKIDIELLKAITLVIEEALYKTPIMLEPARKAELLALVYDYAAESEENQAGIKEHVQRLLRLIRD
jgi:transcriptional regulator with XRE-family HTH domain